MLYLMLCSLLRFLSELAAAQSAASNLTWPDGYRHTSNWAVIINVSRYWFNYRHAANAFSLYHSVKRLGIPDERILVLSADDFACSPRNAFPGQIYADGKHDPNLYTETMQVDYRGYEVTLDSIVRLLTGRHAASTARAKRLLSDGESNVLLYITGHGGNEFMKIQDNEELSAQDLAAAIEEMHRRRRYGRLFLVVETCQAATMFARVRSPGVFLLAASRKGAESYSYGADGDVGVSLIDRFTLYSQRFLAAVGPTSDARLAAWYQELTPSRLRSEIETSEALIDRTPEDIRVTEFLGHVPAVAITTARPLPVEPSQPAPQGASPAPQWRRYLQNTAVAT